MSALTTGLLTITTIAGLAGKAIGALQKANRFNKQGSLSSYSAEMQLRPVIAIEKEISNNESIGTLVNTAIDIFSSFYVTAIGVDNEIGGISVAKIAGKYNPDRKASSTFEVEVDVKDTVATFSFESYQSAKEFNITKESKVPSMQLNAKLSTESITKKLPTGLTDIQLSTEGTDIVLYDPKVAEATQEEADTTSINYSDKQFTKLDGSIENLAVGRHLSINVTRNKEKGVVNMYLRPNLRLIGGRTLVAISGISKQPRSLRERYVAYVHKGSIRDFWDYISCRDFIRAHERNRVEDASKYYEENYKRRTSNGLATLLTGDFSVATVANTWIVSNSTAKRIEAAIQGRLDSQSVRDKFMAETGCMTLIVFDTDYQIVTIYNHGISDVSEISINFLKKKKDKDSVLDMFKMLQGGGNVF